MALTLEKPVFSKARVVLTPLHRENLYKHFQWNNDPELNHLDSEVPFRKETLSAFKRRFEQMIYHPVPDSRDFEICAEDGTVIGVAYVVHLSDHNRHCTLAFHSY